jgi:hypothetical protein
MPAQWLQAPPPESHERPILIEMERRIGGESEPQRRRIVVEDNRKRKSERAVQAQPRCDTGFGATADRLLHSTLDRHCDLARHQRIQRSASGALNGTGAREPTLLHREHHVADRIGSP